MLPLELYPEDTKQTGGLEGEKEFVHVSVLMFSSVIYMLVSMQWTSLSSVSHTLDHKGPLTRFCGTSYPFPRDLGLSSVGLSPSLLRSNKATLSAALGGAG